MTPSKLIVHQKRNDIQLLRCLAIISVLGFHLCSEIVPQGYLGVDIFFVLSGYLMTMLMTSSPEHSLNKSVVIHFYERRLKRLLPAYALVIIGTLITGIFLLISSELSFLKTDTLWAMAFSTNLQNLISGGDYFELVSSYKFLLHTWSLSVEVQFYAIAPFLLAFIAQRKNSVIWVIGIAFASFELQACLESEVMAFGFLFARIWQFLVGTAVFYFEKEHENTSVLKNTSLANSYISFLAPMALVFITFSPLISTTIGYGITIRALATVLTGYVMYLEPPKSVPNNLQHLITVAVYIGDASYSIYLVHWPVIIFAKYFDLFYQTPMIVMIAIIVAISLVQYHLYEKPMIKLNSKTIFIICGTLYLITLFCIKIPSLHSSNLSDIIKLNEKIGSECDIPKFSCYYDAVLTQIIPPIKGAKEEFTCSFNGTGKHIIFVAGNSFAIRQLPAIMEALNGYYKKLYFVARPNCIVFEQFNTKIDKRWHCDAVNNKTIEVLNAIKPDLMVVTERLSMIAEMTAPSYATVEEAKNDKIVSIMSDYLAEFSKYTKHIAFLEPHAMLNVKGHENPAFVLAKKLATGANLSEYYLNRSEYINEIGSGWTKLKAAIATCKQCTAIPLIDYLCTGDKCPLFHSIKLVSYYCDYSHLSSFGIKLLVPPLKKVFSQILT